MIQRIQTVYLLLGAVCLGAFFVFPEVWYMWLAPVNEMLPWVLFVWGAGTALLALGSIFMYANRQRQRQVVVIAQWMTVVFVAALYGLLVAEDRFSPLFRGDIPFLYVVAVLLPIAAYVMFYLARRGIEHDIEKIRSVDRLR